MLILAFGGATLENEKGIISTKKHQAGEVTLDKMHVMLSEAVAAFPFALRIGHYLETCTATELYGVRDMVYDAVGCVFDSRLATQYAFSLACVQK